MKGEERGPERQPDLRDMVALWLLRLAKLGRRRFPDNEGEDEFYDHFFQEKDHRAYREDPRMVVRRNVVNSFLERHVSAGATVVDVGCGLGDVLAGIDSKYARFGVEISRRSARVAARGLGEGTRVVRGQANRLPFASEKVDVCLCLEVLEHLKDEESALREVHRVLRRGGWLIASVPHTYYWDDYLKLIGHYRHYTRRSFQLILERAGFGVERYLPNYPEWHQAFTRRYAVARGLHLVTRPVLGQATVYELRWPWSDQTILEAIRRRLEPKRRLEEEKDYTSADTSTFVAARKRAT
jgi:SAM-dependent methyltransferase